MRDRGVRDFVLGSSDEGSIRAFAVLQRRDVRTLVDESMDRSYLERWPRVSALSNRFGR